MDAAARRTPRHGVALLAVVLLAACAGAPPRRVEPTAAGTAAARALLAARQYAIAPQSRWQFNGRFAVSDGHDSGSAAIEWSQDGAFYTVTVRAPLSSETWRLTGDAELCQLEGDAKGPELGRDPEELLARRTGYHLPLTLLRSWVRGLDGGGAAARAELDDGGRLARLEEAGWRIEYTRWDETADANTAMPLRLRVRRDPYDLRIAVDRWQ